MNPYVQCAHLCAVSKSKPIHKFQLMNICDANDKRANVSVHKIMIIIMITNMNILHKTTKHYIMIQLN